VGKRLVACAEHDRSDLASGLMEAPLGAHGWPRCMAAALRLILEYAFTDAAHRFVMPGDWITTYPPHAMWSTRHYVFQNQVHSTTTVTAIAAGLSSLTVRCEGNALRLDDTNLLSFWARIPLPASATRWPAHDFNLRSISVLGWRRNLKAQVHGHAASDQELLVTINLWTSHDWRPQPKHLFPMPFPDKRKFSSPQHVQVSMQDAAQRAKQAPHSMTSPFHLHFTALLWLRPSVLAQAPLASSASLSLSASASS
jgi:hypothetical protein